jgi:hypothetical protein
MEMSSISTRLKKLVYSIGQALAGLVALLFIIAIINAPFMLFKAIDEEILTVIFGSGLLLLILFGIGRFGYSMVLEPMIYLFNRRKHKE